MLGGQRRRRIGDDDEVRLKMDELGGEVGEGLRLPLPQRYSMRRFFPSTYPRSRSASWNTSRPW